jgi:lysozyme family protein
MNDLRLSVLKPRYQELFTSCQIRSSWLERIASVAEYIVNKRSQYAPIEAQTTTPWWFIGILHYREANFQDAHLHNGDPLTNRTIRFPEGRPLASPANGIAYTFFESAVDALCMMKYDKAKDRSAGAWLWRFEMWDGFDYAKRGINSEYLWNGTNHFGSGANQGIFVAEGQFDPFGKSDRVGAGAILWYFLYKGMLGAEAQELLQTSTETVGNGSASVLVSPGGNASFNYTTQSVGVSTPVGQTQAPIELLNAVKYYRQMPHQDAAIAWLQQQIPSNLLAELARLWRNDSTAQVPVNGMSFQTVQAQVMVPVGWASSPVIPPSAAPSPVVFPPPVVQPLTLAEQIIAYCGEKGYKIDRGVGEKNIIYVEGMYPNGQLNNNEFNAWNDSRLIIEFRNGKPEIVGAWEATTEPGRYYTYNPMNPGGVARIAFGQYQAWQVGTHGQADPHEALIQTAGTVTLYRDLNQDASRTSDRTETGYFGINQHWGGDSPTNDIGGWSAGCLVGRTRDGHREFMALCKQDPRYQQNKEFIFQATVIPGNDLFRRFSVS